MASILVVDDEPEVRNVLRDLLTRTDGHEVDTAADGVEALAKIEANADAYDVILTDLAMPRMDGVTLLDNIVEKWPQLPCIVITALQTEETVLKCLQLGATDYIVKPFQVQAVRMSVERAVKIGNAGLVRDSIEVKPLSKGWVELSGPSELEYLLRFRKFTEALLGAKIDEKIREDIRLAVDEIGRNAIEWGNRFSPSKQVRLAFRLKSDRIEFRVSDEGEGFLPDEVEDPTDDPSGHLKRRMASGKRMGGYGIHIARNVMDKLDFVDGGRTAIMSKWI